MSNWIPARLRPLLGASLDAVDETSLNRLIGVSEAEDLEFKRDMYSTSKGDNKEAAYDVAALANAAGGLIIIGMDEGGSGIATSLKPVPPSGVDIGLWVHQVTAQRLHPPPSITHRPVAITSGEVHLVSVLPSTVRPHAVEVGDGALRFPVRVGTTRRWLTAPELADWYRRRHEAFLAQENKVDSLINEALGTTVPKDPPWAWLMLVSAPVYKGDLRLRRNLAEDWRDWIQTSLTEFPGYGRAPLRQSRISYRCIELSDGYQRNDPPFSQALRLHLDGSGLLLLGYPGGRQMGVPPEVATLYDEHLIGDLVNGVGVLARHALRAGAVGETILGAALHSHQEMMVAQCRSTIPDVLSGSRAVTGYPGPTSRHSAPLEEVSAPGTDLIAAARLLASDLLSSFGLPEPQQITEGLELVRSRFQRDWQHRLVEWAGYANVAVIESA